MTRFLGAILCTALLLPPIPAGAASGCPPFTEKTRKLPAGGEKRTVLPRPACVDKEAREKAQERDRALPLPPKCPEGEAPVYRHGRWDCRAAR